MLRVKIIVPFLVAFILLTLVFSWGWGGKGGDRYLLTGSSTIAPIMGEIAVWLRERNPDLKVDVQTGGSTRGIADTRDGLNNAGMASRDLSADEAEGLDVYSIGYDGIAIIVNADNPITALSSEQVRHLFTKEIKQWETISSHKGAVRVINKAEGRATLEVFLKHFNLENRQIQADAVIGDNAQGVRLIAADPQAIGYVSIGEALHAKGRGTPIKLLPLDGVHPTPSTVADGSYPIRRTLHLLFRDKADDQGKKILASLQSPEGQKIIQGLGFVPAKTM